MKLRHSIALLFALAWGGSGCVNGRPHPESSAVSDAPVSGSTMPVVVERNVNRKDPDKSRFASEAVRNYLRDSLEESITACGVFNVVEDVPGATEHPDLAHISAAIISVRRKVITFSGGPFASVQKAFVDAEIEVRLTRPHHVDIVVSGKSHVSQSEDAVIVAARQFKDWIFDDSWASVACKEALQKACHELADKIKITTDQRVLGLHTPS